MTAHTNYPDTAESGETYDVERGSAQASLEGQRMEDPFSESRHLVHLGDSVCSLLFVSTPECTWWEKNLQEVS